MNTARISLRLGSDLLAAAEAYAKEHGMDRATVVRLALIEQLKRKPPKKLPEGAARLAGNPDIANIGKSGAEARWGKRERDSRDT